MKRDLITKADRIFSAYIRHRGENQGYNTCYTCNRVLLFEELQCGHFIKRGFLNTRFHPVNCWPQCNECNVEKRGNLVVYEAKLRAMFGDDAIDGLIDLAYSDNKVYEHDIQEIITKYK